MLIYTIISKEYEGSIHDSLIPDNESTAHNDFTLKINASQRESTFKPRLYSVVNKGRKSGGISNNNTGAPVNKLSDKYFNNKDVKKIESACGNYIYHVSIIDYLQKYDMSKKLERFSKLFLMGCKNGKDLSSIDPATYKQRFLNFQKKVVFSNIK